MQGTRVRFLGREDPLEKERTTHSGIFAWRIPWMEEPGRLQSTGLQEPYTTGWPSPQADRLKGRYCYPHLWNQHSLGLSKLRVSLLPPSPLLPLQGRVPGPGGAQKPASGRSWEHHPGCAGTWLWLYCSQVAKMQHSPWCSGSGYSDHRRLLKEPCSSAGAWMSPVCYKNESVFVYFLVWGVSRSLGASADSACSPFRPLVAAMCWSQLTTGFQGIKPESMQHLPISMVQMLPACGSLCSLCGNRLEASLVLRAMETSGLSRLGALLLKYSIPLCSCIHLCLWGFFVWPQIKWYLIHFSSTCYFYLRLLAISLGLLLGNGCTVIPWRDYLNLFPLSPPSPTPVPESPRWLPPLLSPHSVHLHVCVLISSG